MLMALSELHDSKSLETMHFVHTNTSSYLDTHIASVCNLHTVEPSYQLINLFARMYCTLIVKDVRKKEAH